MPSWSSVRKHIRERIVPALRDRIDFHYTVYEARDADSGRKARRNSRFWITVDGEQVFSCAFLVPSDRTAAAHRETPEAGVFAKAQAEKIPRPDDLREALQAYLNLAIETARASDNPVLRALAFVDARTGKRTFDKLAPGEDEHELVKLFWRLRSESKAAR